MKATEMMVILGHGKEQQLINYNLENHWHRLRLPYIGFGPIDDPFTLPGCETMLNIGNSCRAGPAHLSRIRILLHYLKSLPHDRFLLLEYDAINFIDRLPYFRPGMSLTVGSCLCPWRFDRETLERLVRVSDWWAYNPKSRPKMTVEQSLLYFQNGAVRVPTLTDVWLHFACYHIAAIRVHHMDRWQWAWHWEDHVIADYHRQIAAGRIDFLHGVKSIEVAKKLVNGLPGARHMGGEATISQHSIAAQASGRATVSIVRPHINAWGKLKIMRKS